MLSALALLMVLFFLFWIGMHITGAILVACIWLFIRLPLALLFGLIGLACICTILLIPVGLFFIRLGWDLLIPDR